MEEDVNQPTGDPETAVPGDVEFIPKRDRVLNINEVMERTGLSDSTIWRMRRKHKFPSPIRLSGNRIGWNSQEIEKWVDERPPGLIPKLWISDASASAAPPDPH